MRPSVSIDSAMDCGLKGKHYHEFELASEQHHAHEAHGHDHPQRHCLLPQEIYDHVADAGAAKPRGSILKELICGVMAGCFIGFGFATCMLAAGQMSPDYRKSNPGMFNLLFGAYGFPVGLCLVIINGASLFTSNIAYMMAAYIEGKATSLQSLWIVWLSYFTNLCGSLLLVGLMVAGDVFLHREAFTIELAHKKIGYSFGATLTKGILCNWMVCMAMWQANAAQDITSKLLGIWFPISAFVTMGFEHSVANMFLFPLAIMLGADITPCEFIAKNLVPVTIGNLIGGGFFVATFFGLSYGNWEKVIMSHMNQLWARCAPTAFMLHVNDAAASSNGSSSGHKLNTKELSAMVAELPVAVTVHPTV